MNKKILFLGDIIGKPGRQILKERLAKVKEEEGIFFTIANGENGAGGFGLTKKIMDEIFMLGIDCLTSGNHIWDKKDIIPHLSVETKLLRPANYPAGVEGFGYNIFEKEGIKLGVINLQGRIFMKPIDCPFRIGDIIVEEVSRQTKNIIIDFHAEATAEKQALGYYFAGRVTAVIGTHTHVPTADERILEGNTAYITDVGMVGGFDSIIGNRIEDALAKLILQKPTHLNVSEKDLRIFGVIVEFDADTGKALSIKRLIS
ncbi:MAG: TIGR00282 family metallophosphoesterase [candidate division WOR-3 bacterium]